MRSLRPKHEAANVGFMAERQRLVGMQEDVNAFMLNEDAKVCRACGHPLTPQHFREELERRRSAISALTKECAAAEKRLAAITKRRGQAEVAHKASGEETDRLRQAYLAARAANNAAVEDLAQCHHSLAETLNELASVHRDRVGDNAEASSYPTSAELAEMKAQAQKLPKARQSLKVLETQARDVKVLDDRVAELSADAKAQSDLLGGRMPDEIAAEESRLTQEAASLRTKDSGLEKLILEARKRLEQVSAKAESAGRVADEARHRHDAARQREASCGERYAEALAKLPPGILGEGAGVTEVRSAISAVELSLRRLETSGVEREYRELEPTRLRADSLDRRLAESQTIVEGYVPVPRASPVISAELAALRAKTSEAERRHTLLASDAASAKRRWEQLRELAEETMKARADSSAAMKLAELLGRDYLQRHLMRAAERSIVERANAILDRLSSGSLSLQLRPQAEAGAETALDMEVLNRELQGTQMLGLAFLSGSQKFRVAVALALAIGQYASRQSRPVETVMIDEGFGCLDQQGRTEVIQEFQNLRDLMKCVILVSHQEEIAQVFPNRYEFRLEDGTTKVTRVS